jgi:hypothetical protein
MRTFTTLILLLFASPLFAGVFVMNGIYQGSDIYVKNPFASDGVGFCVYEVHVNGEVSSDEVNSSAFAIDLSLWDLLIGDPVVITIMSKDDCEPKVINPQSIAPKSTYELVKGFHIEDKLHWSTEGELGSLPFIVEQFKWNKWVEVGLVVGKGTKEAQDYNVKVPMHFGENQYRLKQIDSSGPHYSAKIVCTSEIPPVKLKSERVTDKVEFSGFTAFELYNEYGELILENQGASFGITTLPNGKYYLNYADQFGKLIIKK